VLEEAIADPAFTWGELLELAINGKVTCLLAEVLTSDRMKDAVPPRFLRFLSRELRCNLHATHIYRAEAARIIIAARQAEITCAAVKGIAAESALYGGRGARQLSDIDMLVTPAGLPAISAVLTGLGYRARHGRGRSARQAGRGPARASFARDNNDIIIPVLAVDLITGYPGISGGVPPLAEAALGRRTWQPVPGHPGHHLPVLTAADQLAFTMAAIAADPAEPSLSLCADALRLAALPRGCGKPAPWLAVPAAEAARRISGALPGAGAGAGLVAALSPQAGTPGPGRAGGGP